MRKKILILGSNDELSYAERMSMALSERFSNEPLDFECVLWNNPLIWKNGSTTLPSLIDMAIELKREGGFVLAVFTPDDVVELRGKSQFCSRDNVWLEYGLFVGMLGISHVFAMCPQNTVTKAGKELDWRKPSDFQQYSLFYQYKDKADDANLELRGLATIIVDKIKKALRSA
ncbi:MAG: nucleotide-binding protein [Clostridia bacterium]|nr:nucleotide-binding protein [Clostridia bacterium]